MNIAGKYLRNAMNFYKFVLAILFFASTTQAITIVAILETTTDSEESLKIQELKYLTDELRNKAMDALTNDKFSVLTRDGIISLLPPDEESAECLAEGCAVDIARAIGADIVAQGRVGVFAGMLTMTVELYETASGKLLGSFVGESENTKGLLEIIRTKSSALFANIPGVKKAEPSEPSKVSETTAVEPATPLSPPNNSSIFEDIKIGVHLGGGFSQLSANAANDNAANENKGGASFFIGLLFSKNFSFLYLEPELLLSSEFFELNGKTAKNLNTEFNLSVKIPVPLVELFAGTTVSFPLLSQIDGANIGDRSKFNIGAFGGISYRIFGNLFADVSYSYYFTDYYTSIKKSKQSKVLCGIIYLF